MASHTRTILPPPGSDFDSYAAETAYAMAVEAEASEPVEVDDTADTIPAPRDEDSTPTLRPGELEFEPSAQPEFDGDCGAEAWS